MSHIQAVLFDRSKWTPSRAKYWLNTNGFQPIKRVHKTKKKLRYRLVEPEEFARFITKKEKDGISFVIGFYS